MEKQKEKYTCPKCGDIISIHDRECSEFKKDLEEVANFKGSRAEKLIMLFCKQTKLKYSRLTEEEKQWLTRIARSPNWRKALFPSG